MKTKFLSVIIAVLIICSLAVFTSCGDTENNLMTVFEEALAKTSNLENFDADMDMNMSIDAGGVTVETLMDMNTKVTGAKSENPIFGFNMIMSIPVLGSEMALDMYIKDGWAYMVSEGQGLKLKADDELVDSYNYSGMLDSMSGTLPEELKSNTVVTENEDGTLSAVVTIPDELFVELFGEISDSLDDIGIGENPSVTGATLNYTVADGYVTTVNMEFNMFMTVADTETAANVTIDAVYNNPGAEVIITPPEGYESFPEISDEVIEDTGSDTAENTVEDVEVAA